MRTVAVIGKNFGDEGKGLAVDYLARHADRPLVVRHNGGAQSGHTVERREPAGKRFIFHELSAGSVCGADTLWIDSYLPDLYKLREELRAFRGTFGFAPGIWAEEGVCVTLPDDVLINMALETSRGDRRHGSCGMGINECTLRADAGFGLSLRELCRMDPEGIFRRLRQIRKEYASLRLQTLAGELTGAAEPYLELLADENVLRNAAEEMAENLSCVQVLSEPALRELLRDVGTLIFESGQGLLLDRDNAEFAPHVTASSTGLKNPLAFLRRMGYGLDAAVYVSRTYVTRHGAGRLPLERPARSLGAIGRDRTNEPNEWQGGIRYAPHESAAGFVAEVRRDLSRCGGEGVRAELFLTHLNETEDCVALPDRRVPIRTFLALPEITGTFRQAYLSDSPCSEDVRTVTL